MEARRWDARLGVGIEAIDSEHRLQIELINALETALGNGRARAEAGALLEKLLDFTNNHFLAEELLMRLHGYPGYEVHVQDHDNLIRQMAELKNSFASGEHADAVLVTQAMRSWLSGHIEGMDRALAMFLLEKAAATP